MQSLRAVHAIGTGLNLFRKARDPDGEASSGATHWAHLAGVNVGHDTDVAVHVQRLLTPGVCTQYSRPRDIRQSGAAGDHHRRGCGPGDANRSQASPAVPCCAAASFTDILAERLALAEGAAACAWSWDRQGVELSSMQARRSDRLTRNPGAIAHLEGALNDGGSLQGRDHHRGACRSHSAGGCRHSHGLAASGAGGRSGLSVESHLGWTLLHACKVTRPGSPGPKDWDGVWGCSHT